MESDRSEEVEKSVRVSEWPRTRPQSVSVSRMHNDNDNHNQNNNPGTSQHHSTQHTFVVQDLEKKIRDSARIASTPSTPVSGGSRSGSVPATITPNPILINNLEACARNISANLDVLLRDLRGSLHGMSDLTVETSECYAEAITTTCDSVDAVIKNTYAMLAKVEELNEAMSGVKRLAQQVKEIKRVVDLFESQCIRNPP